MRISAILYPLRLRIGRAFPVEAIEGQKPYDLPFSPLDLSEASMLEHLGFQFEGHESVSVCDPCEIPIATFVFEKKRPAWKFW